MRIVSELPKIKDINNNDIFEIINHRSTKTHSFFKYPAKFIPEIANWSIRNFSKKGEIILDCFAGSGTSLVEASFLERIPYAIDFDPLSQIITKSKVNYLNIKNINKIINDLEKIVFTHKNPFIPEIPDIYKWFPEKNIKSLGNIYSNLIKYKKNNENIYNFLITCFVSTIRKSSYADDTSPKPYVSTRIKKIPLDSKKLFTDTVIKNLKIFQSKNFKLKYKVKIIGNDARKIINKKVDHVISSPPYINAFDYVRILRLENLWINSFKNSEIINHKKKQIGTEIIGFKDYIKKPKKFGYDALDKKILNVYRVDKKRAFIIIKYFNDMFLNLKNIYKVLKKNSFYTIVVGDCLIRNNKFETAEYLSFFANKIGFKQEKKFSYIIKNPYLRIPRAGKGSIIKFDRILVLKK